MANPTTIVQNVRTPYTEEFEYGVLRAVSAGSSALFVPGEMMGIALADGCFDHFDDAEPMIFAGLWEGPQRTVLSTDPAETLLCRVRRPKRFSMPLQTGTGAVPTDIGKPAFAYDSGKVAVVPGSLTYCNVAGHISGIVAGKPATLSGATQVYIDPPALNRPRDLQPGLMLQATLSADADNYAPTGLQFASWLQLTPSGATRSITGISAGFHGQKLLISNVSATQILTLVNASGSSSAANRILGANAADVSVRPQGNVELIYDSLAASSTGRWRTLAI